MISRPIALLILGLLLIAGAYALAFAGNTTLAPWGLGLGAADILAAMLWLGAQRNGRLPRTLGIALSVSALATAAGFVWAFLAPAPVADGPLLLGLPRVTAVMLLLTGALPLVLLPLAYARAFDSEVLDEAALERVQSLSKKGKP